MSPIRSRSGPPAPVRLLLGAAAFAGALVAVPATAAPPDVVLVVVDTLRADRLGSHGASGPTSPRLDGLAARGVRFAAAHATSS